MEIVNQKISEALRIKGMTKRDLCLAIGMTENGLKKSLDNGVLKIQTLFDIAKTLNRPVQYFLGISDTIIGSESNEMDFDKMRKAFTLDKKEDEKLKMTPENYVLREDLNYERKQHDKLVASLEKNVTLLEEKADGTDKRSDKALIDYTSAGNGRWDNGIAMEGETDLGKKRGAVK